MRKKALSQLIVFTLVLTTIGVWGNSRADDKNVAECPDCLKQGVKMPDHQEVDKITALYTDLSDRAQGPLDACTIKLDVTGFVCAESSFDDNKYRSLNPNTRGAPKKIWEHMDELRASALSAIGMSAKDVADYKAKYGEDPLPNVFDPYNQQSRINIADGCRAAQARLGDQNLRSTDNRTFSVPIGALQCSHLKDFTAKAHALTFGKAANQDKSVVNTTTISVKLPVGTDKKPADVIYKTLLDKMGIDSDLQAELESNSSRLDTELLAKSGIDAGQLKSMMADLKTQLAAANSSHPPLWLTHDKDGNPVITLKIPKVAEFSSNHTELDLIDANNCKLKADVHSLPCSGQPEDIALWKKIFPGGNPPKQAVSAEDKAYYAKNFPDYDPSIKTITPDYIRDSVMQDLGISAEEQARFMLISKHPMIPSFTDPKNDSDRAQFLGQCRTAQKMYLNRTVNYRDPEDHYADSTFAVPIPANSCKEAVTFAKRQLAIVKSDKEKDTNFTDALRSFATYKYEENIDPNLQKKWAAARYPTLAKWEDLCLSGFKNPTVTAAAEFQDAYEAIKDASYVTSCGPEAQAAYEKLEKVRDRMKHLQAEGSIRQNNLCYSLGNTIANLALMGGKMAPAMLAPEAGGPLITTALFSVGAAGSSYEASAQKRETTCEATNKAFNSAVLTAAFFESTGALMSDAGKALDESVGKAEAKYADAKMGQHKAAEWEVRKAKLTKLIADDTMTCGQMYFNTALNNTIANEPGASMEEILKGTGTACAQAVAMGKVIKGAAKGAQSLQLAGKQVHAETASGGDVSAKTPLKVGDIINIDKKPYKITVLNPSDDIFVATATSGNGKVATRWSDVEAARAQTEIAQGKAGAREVASDKDATSDDENVTEAGASNSTTYLKKLFKGWIQTKYKNNPKMEVETEAAIESVLSKELSPLERDKLKKLYDDGHLSEDQFDAMVEGCGKSVAFDEDFIPGVMVGESNTHLTTSCHI
jgi:hypothetical protein